MSDTILKPVETDRVKFLESALKSACSCGYISLPDPVTDRHINEACAGDVRAKLDPEGIVYYSDAEDGEAVYAPELAAFLREIGR